MQETGTQVVKIDPPPTSKGGYPQVTKNGCLTTMLLEDKITCLLYQCDTPSGFHNFIISVLDLVN